MRRLLGVLALVKKHGAAAVDDACAAALELQVADYRFVRRYLERHPAAPLTLRQVDPLIRDLTHYRDVIARQDPGGDPDMNLVELQHALRQLRCSGMAAGLEPRLLEAQTAKLAPIDFLSTLVQDEPCRRQDRLLERRVAAGGLPRSRQDPGHVRLRLQQEDEPPPRLRDSPPARFVAHHADGLLLRSAGHGEEPLGPKRSASPSIQQGHRVLLPRGPRAASMSSRTRQLARHPQRLVSAPHHRPAPGHRRSRDEAPAAHRRRGSPSRSSCADTRRASTLITSNRPVEDWGKLLGDTAAVTALLDRLPPPRASS